MKLHSRGETSLGKPWWAFGPHPQHATQAVADAAVACEALRAAQAAKELARSEVGSLCSVVARAEEEYKSVSEQHRIAEEEVSGLQAVGAKICDLVLYFLGNDLASFQTRRNSRAARKCHG
jgi:hypothetical protein